MTSAPSGRLARLDSLTGLRWWAAFGVFAHHASNLAPLPIYEVLGLGNFGVMFFFVLSGFVLTWSARPDVPAKTFWVRRFARIYPSHFVALIVAIPVFYSFAPDPAQGWVKPFDLGVLLLSVVLVQGWWRDPVILFSGNPAAWTLTCEAFFYSLHPAINRVVLWFRARSILLIAVAIVIGCFGYRAAALLWPETFAAVVPIPVARLSEFVLGMCIAHAMRLGWRLRLSPWVVYASIAAFSVWFAYSPVMFSGGWVGTLLRASANEWFIVMCVLLIAAVATRDANGGRSLLRSRVLVKLGELSYTFYLMHATAIYAVLAIVGRQPTSWANLLWYAAMLAVGLGLAALLHYFVEKPCERFIRQRWDARQARRATGLRG